MISGWLIFLENPIKCHKGDTRPNASHWRKPYRNVLLFGSVQWYSLILELFLQQERDLADIICDPINWDIGFQKYTR